jgi:AraC-like DNA-binding protein
MAGITVDRETNTISGSPEDLTEGFQRATEQIQRANGQFAFAEIAGETPTLSLFSASGELSSYAHELKMFQRVRVTLLDEETGEEIASESGYVSAAGAAEKKDADGDSITARVHKIKLGG